MTRALPATGGGRVLAAVGVLAAAGAAMATGAPAPAAAVFLAAVLGGALAAALAARTRAAALATALCALAATLGVWRGAASAPPGPGRLPAGAVIVEGTVRETPAVRSTEVIVIVDVTAASPPVPGLRAVALALVGRSPLGPGDRIRVQAAHLRAPSARPGPLAAALLDRDGVDAVAVSPRVTPLATGPPSLARALARARAGLTGTLDAALPEPDATVVGALAFGVRGRLPPDVDTSLRDAGLIHLVATSGLKIAIVAAIWVRLLGAWAVPPRVRGAAVMVGIAAYVAVAGGGAAAVRSALMAGAGIGLGRGGRRVDSTVALCLLAGAFLLVDPGLGRDPGFQLSFLGTLGIVALAAPIAARIPGPRMLAEPLAVTAAAQIATLPIQGATFGTVSVVAPLTNALAVPAVGPLLLLATLGVALTTVSPWLGAFPLFAAQQLARWVVTVARGGAAIPGAAHHPGAWPVAWTVGAVAAAIAVVAGVTRWRRPDGEGHHGGVAEGAGRGATRAIALAGVAATIAISAAGGLLLGALPDGRLHVIVLPAGQGPAVLVRTASGGLALVDAGADPAALLTSLGAALPAGTRTLDLLVLTGGERPAVGGLADLTMHLHVGRVVVPDAPLGSGARAAVEVLRRDGATVDVVPVGAPWAWAGAAWRCLALAPPDAPAAATVATCALQVSGGGATALLLGDATSSQQDELAAEGEGIRSDLVVAPPGGALSGALVAAAAPHLVAVAGVRAPRMRLDAVLPAGVEVATVAAGGSLSYAGGAGDGLRPA